MGVNYFLLLSSLGLAVTIQAQDCNRPKLGPNMNLKDTDILRQTFPDGTKVYLSCDVGYQSAGGSSAITCTAGSWSPVRLTCERKYCGSAGEVLNGQVDYSQGTQFGDKAGITCDTGYTLVGSRELICGDQGWMNRLPVCEVVKCLQVHVVVNGTFSPNKEEYEYGDVVQYTCQKDYTLIGSKSVTCSEDGTFSPESPTCRMVNCAEPKIVNGYWDAGSRPPHRLSSTVTLKCHNGYTMNGKGTQTCDINSKWSPGLPTCEPKNCSRPEPGPNMNLKDTDMLLQTFVHGTEVSLSCDVGYMSAGGSSVITCTTGNWSPVRLTCERKNCGSAGEVQDGHVNYPTGTQFGDKAVITCNSGYKLVGSRELVCGDQGWLNRLPVCEVVKCLQVPVVVNGVFSPNKEEYEYRDVVQYTCQKDYTLIGSKSVTCSEDGTFSPEPPTCRMVECAEPKIVNGYWDAGSRPPHRLSSTVTLKCHNGYRMNGKGTQTCDINGKWSPGLPTCERDIIECDDPSIVNGVWEGGSGHPHTPSSKVTFKCNSGYVIKGEVTQTCDRNGKWSPGLPTCEYEGSNLPVILGCVAGILFIGLIGLYIFYKKKNRSNKGSHNKDTEEQLALS